MNLTRGSSSEEPQKCGEMGPGCGKVAGGGMSAGMGCVRMFNTGDDGGEKLLEATVPLQVWTNLSSPRDGQSENKKNKKTRKRNERTAPMESGLNINLLEFVGLIRLYLTLIQINSLSCESANRYLIGHGPYVDILSRTCSPMEPRYRAQKKLQCQGMIENRFKNEPATLGFKGKHIAPTNTTRKIYEYIFLH